MTFDTIDPFSEAVEVLLVDDDEPWANVTARLLEHNVDAFDVETADCLESGRDRYDALDPDCIVCDYQLGDGTGLALLETVRERDPELPFILVTGRGDERVASEATRKGITEYIVKEHDDEEAELLTVRVANAVRSHRTQRALQRQRRSNTAMLELLTATSDEVDLCREFCSLLVENHDYACAWIGTETERAGVVTRAAAGADGALDDALHDPSFPAADADPALAALESDDPVVRTFPTPSVEADSDGTTLEAIADTHGIDAAAGLPIRYEGVRLGVLGVYTDDRAGIDQQRLSLLEDLTDTLGYALHTAEFKRSLLTDRPISAGIELADENAPLVALAGALPRSAEIVVPSVVLRDDGSTLYLARMSGVDADDVAEGVDASAGLAFAEGTAPSQDDDEHLIECGLVASDPTPESRLADHGASFDRTVVEDRLARITVRIPDHDDISTLEAALTAAYDEATVATIRQEQGGDSLASTDALLEPLTKKQHDALRHGYYGGFFEHPRDTTATELAEQFGVTRQTITHHLRAAERKLLDQVFDG